jgi:uncharacterized CHY-type Zn-finger protein
MKERIKKKVMCGVPHKIKSIVQYKKLVKCHFVRLKTDLKPYLTTVSEIV